MSTAAQCVANRANSSQSTGPRTENGKSVSSRNAIKHGLTSRSPIIPGEDAEEYAVFAEEMLHSLRPRGLAERGVVERLAVVAWKLRRIGALERMLIQEQIEENDTVIDPAGPLLDEIERDNSTLMKLQTYEYRLERMHASLLRQLERLKKARREAEQEMHQDDEELTLKEESDDSVKNAEQLAENEADTSHRRDGDVMENVENSVEISILQNEANSVGSIMETVSELPDLELRT